jgi:4-amino-4-deoxy-L-arabinose transferase-like glycosyltransferase
MNAQAAAATSAGPNAAVRLPRRFLWLFILVLVFAAGWFRFYRLGQEEFWGDEILFLRMCQPGLSVMEVIQQHLQSFGYVGHLPVTAALSNLAMSLQGLHSQADITPLAARLPSAVLGWLGLLVAAWWVWRLTRRAEIALAALVVGACSFIHIWHSREAYYYAGQFLFAALTLLCWTELTRAEIGRRHLALWLGYAASLLMLAFAHPAGSALLVPLSLCSLAFAVRDRIRWRRHVVLAVLGLAVCLLILLLAGKPRPPAPWNSEYRFSFWVVIPDLLENFVFGPGNLRLLLAIVVFLAGAVWLWRCKDGPTLACLALVPLVFLAIHVGGRSSPYATKYFLLLWPLLMLVIAAGLGAAVAALPERWRASSLVLLAVLVAVNVAPGLQLLYQLRSRSECFASLARYLEQRVESGTVCLWDGGHALRFLPGFVVPQRPLLYSALPDASAENYVNGRVQQQLANLRRAFPAVAYLEWGGLQGPYARRVAGSAEKITQVNAGIAALFPQRETIRDAKLEAFLRSGWYPGVPRLCADRAQRIADTLAHAPAVFHASAAESGSLVAPVFDPGTWQLVFSRDHQPLLLGAPQAALLLEKNLEPRIAAGAYATLHFIALQAGELTLLANGNVVQQVRIEQPGAGGAIHVPWHGERLVIEVRFQGAAGSSRPDQPAYALTGVAVRQGLPPLASPAK